MKSLIVFVLGLTSLSSPIFGVEEQLERRLWCDTRDEAPPTQMILVNRTAFELGRRFALEGQHDTNGSGNWNMSFDTTITAAEPTGTSPLLYIVMDRTSMTDRRGPGTERLAARYVRILWDRGTNRGTGWFRTQNGSIHQLTCLTGP